MTEVKNFDDFKFFIDKDLKFSWTVKPQITGGTSSPRKEVEIVGAKEVSLR